MASKPAPKPVAKKAAPVRGMRTSTHMAGAIASPTATQKAQEKKWQAQDDLRTLQRAAEVKADPSRVKQAQVEATAQMKALASVTKK